MRVDFQIQDKIAQEVIKRDKKERDGRVESGRLTASMLGQPLQWQILKMIGVPSGVKDEYTLRKFQRGRDVEDWLCNIIGATDSQKKVEYRGVTGKLDGTYDDLPLEVKSTANAKFKWIKARRRPDAGHLLQGTLYALAEGAQQFLICYVASDDYRTLTFVCEAAMYVTEVNRIIGEVDSTFALGYVPEFAPYNPETQWQAKPEYNNYPEWQNLTQNQIEIKLEAEYPESLKKLKAPRKEVTA